MEQSCMCVGSNSNVAEHGMDKEEGRAAIWEINAQTQLLRVSRRHTRQTSAAGSGRDWHRSRLRTRPAYRVVGARAFEGNIAASAIRRRDVRRATRLVEPKAPQRATR